MLNGEVHVNSEGVFQWFKRQGMIRVVFLTAGTLKPDSIHGKFILARLASTSRRGKWTTLIMANSFPIDYFLLDMLMRNMTLFFLTI